MSRPEPKTKNAEKGLDRVAYASRLRPKQHRELKKRAQKNKRSIQAEIDDILRVVLGVE